VKQASSIADKERIKEQYQQVGWPPPSTSIFSLLFSFSSK
jgi:hypothetical protein